MRRTKSLIAAAAVIGLGCANAPTALALCVAHVRLVNHTQWDFRVKEFDHQKEDESSWRRLDPEPFTLKPGEIDTLRSPFTPRKRKSKIKWRVKGDLDTKGDRTYYSQGYVQCNDWHHVAITP